MDEQSDNNSVRQQYDDYQFQGQRQRDFPILRRKYDEDYIKDDLNHFYYVSRIRNDQTKPQYKQHYEEFFGQVESDVKNHIKNYLDNEQLLNKYKFTILNYKKKYKFLSTTKFKFVKNYGHQFKHTIMNYEVYLGKFKFTINLLNLSIQVPQPQQQQLIKNGLYKKLVRVPFEGFIARRRYFEYPQYLLEESQDKIQWSILPSKSDIQHAIQQFAIYKICSFFKIGPQIKMDLYFDLICFNDCIQFYIEQCVYNKPKSPKFQYRIKFCIRILHKFQIIHKNIKNKNLLFSNTMNDEVISDFGLSQIIFESLGCKSKAFKEGNYYFMSDQMKNMQNNKQQLVDLYYNDLNGLLVSFQRQQQKWYNDKMREPKKVQKKNIFYEFITILNNFLSKKKLDDYIKLLIQYQDYNEQQIIVYFRSLGSQLLYQLKNQFNKQQLKIRKKIYKFIFHIQFAYQMAEQSQQKQNQFIYLLRTNNYKSINIINFIQDNKILLGKDYILKLYRKIFRMYQYQTFHKNKKKILPNKTFAQNYLKLNFIKLKTDTSFLYRNKQNDQFQKIINKIFFNYLQGLLSRQNIQDYLNNIKTMPSLNKQHKEYIKYIQIFIQKESWGIQQLYDLIDYDFVYVQKQNIDQLRFIYEQIDQVQRIKLIQTKASVYQLNKTKRAGNARKLEAALRFFIRGKRICGVNKKIFWLRYLQIRILTTLDLDYEVVDLVYNLGCQFLNQTNYKFAIKLFLLAVQSEYSSISPQYLHNIYNQLALCYFKIGQYEKGLGYNISARNLTQKTYGVEGLKMCLINILTGNFYYAIGRILQKNQADKQNYNRQIERTLKLISKQISQNIFIYDCWENKQFNSLVMYQLGVLVHQKTLEMCNQLDPDSYTIYDIKLSLSKGYKLMLKYKDAHRCLQQCLKIKVFSKNSYNIEFAIIYFNKSEINFLENKFADCIRNGQLGLNILMKVQYSDNQLLQFYKLLQKACIKTAKTEKISFYVIKQIYFYERKELKQPLVQYLQKILQLTFQNKNYQLFCFYCQKFIKITINQKPLYMYYSKLSYAYKNRSYKKIYIRRGQIYKKKQIISLYFIQQRKKIAQILKYYKSVFKKSFKYLGLMLYFAQKNLHFKDFQFLKNKFLAKNKIKYAGMFQNIQKNTYLNVKQKIKLCSNLKKAHALAKRFQLNVLCTQIKQKKRILLKLLD